jgi:hypothetical protein
VGSDSTPDRFSYNDSPNRSTGKIPFQIVYGMHLRGISELRDLKHDEFRSGGVEDFATEIQKLHDQTKRQLHESSHKYKNRVDQKRREIHFNVRDQVLSYLRKERFPRGTSKKLNMKKIGPCKILRKFDEDAYEIELSDDVGISPIFNVAYLYPYMMNDTGGSNDQKEI